MTSCGRESNGRLDRLCGEGDDGEDFCTIFLAGVVGVFLEVLGMDFFLAFIVFVRSVIIGGVCDCLISLVNSF